MVEVCMKPVLCANAKRWKFCRCSWTIRTHKLKGERFLLYENTGVAFEEDV